LNSFNGVVLAENFPHPQKGEHVCFVPFLLRGLGFPIHPFLRGLLAFYGIQLHHLTPGSILHISGFVALCEMFLGCEAHFELWRKYFCLVPRTRDGTIFEVGGAEVCRIAGTGYPVGTPKEFEMWTSEWFYIEDVPLFDPTRRGLPEYSDAFPKKRYNWRPKSLPQEESAEVLRLSTHVRLLAHHKLTMIDVMAAVLTRCVQPLQQRVHPLWRYNGTSDTTRSRRLGPADQTALAAALADLFKGEQEDFVQRSSKDGYSCHNPIEWVSLYTYCNYSSVFPLCPFLTEAVKLYANRNGGASSRQSTVRLLNPKTMPVRTIRAITKTRTYQSNSKAGFSTRRALITPKWPSLPTTLDLFLPPP
jgi:hypothetical protein